MEEFERVGAEALLLSLSPPEEVLVGGAGDPAYQGSGEGGVVSRVHLGLRLCSSLYSISNYAAAVGD